MEVKEGDKEAAPVSNGDAEAKPEEASEAAPTPEQEGKKPKKEKVPSTPDSWQQGNQHTDRLRQLL